MADYQRGMIDGQGLANFQTGRYVAELENELAQERLDRINTQAFARGLLEVLKHITLNGARPGETIALLDQIFPAAYAKRAYELGLHQLIAGGSTAVQQEAAESLQFLRSEVRPAR